MELIAVGIDPTEDAEALRAFRDAQGFPWQHYLSNPDLLADYQVAIRSTKVAVSQEGILTYRAGYGVNSNEEWERVFQGLTGSDG